VPPQDLANWIRPGLRPEAELWPLDWKSINLADKLIDVTKSKNSISHRFVKISDNLVAWLAPYAKKSGRVTFGRDSYYTRLQCARHRAAETLESQSKESLKLRLSAQDTMRHTFATMHLCASQVGRGDRCGARARRLFANDAAPLFESGDAGGCSSLLATGSLSRAMRSA